MNSLSSQLVLQVLGRAKGTAANPKLISTLNGRSANVALRSTATAGTSTYANNGTDQSRTLAAGANETLDLRSFTNQTQETAQALGKVRTFYVIHAPTSAASSISVGNSGANAFVPLGCFGATAAQLPPGGFVAIGVPSAAGVTADATHKDVKVVNNDGAQIATYYIGWWGE